MERHLYMYICIYTCSYMNMYIDAIFANYFVYPQKAFQVLKPVLY